MDIEIKLYHGNCLKLMDNIPDGSMDMVLCDLPYGTVNRKNTHARCDIKLPLNELWKSYNRIIKEHGAIVLFGSGMFTAELMMSNMSMWRYNLIWDKVNRGYGTSQCQ